MKKQSGFTLIELIISMALGVGLSWVVLEISLTTQRNNHDILATGDLVEKGILVIDLLTREINHAGFYGDITVAHGAFDGQDNGGLCSRTPTPSNLRTAIYGLDNVVPSDFSLCGTPSILPGSDVLQLRRASTFVVSPPYETDRHYIQSTLSVANVAPHDPLANMWTSLREMDGLQNAPVREFYQTTYYLGDDNMFKRIRLVDGELVTEVLMSGVDDFQVQYESYLMGHHQLTDAHSNYSFFGSWSNVSRVLVSWVISGKSVGQPDRKAYMYGNKISETFTTGDDAQKKRRLFQVSVSVNAHQ